VHYSRDGSSKERLKRDRTRRGMRAEKYTRRRAKKCTRKEIGLENELHEKRGLKGTLKKEVRLENTLPKS
jgi:hypothetical protein